METSMIKGNVAELTAAKNTLNQDVSDLRAALAKLRENHSDLLAVWEGDASQKYDETFEKYSLEIGDFVADADAVVEALGETVIAMGNANETVHSLLGQMDASTH
ncbi:MAG: WXG100 family type VII secretion target [Lachnospiraceae bacterium]|nr:WXG100 family type VII secretion target [Lachnospiraceae bacterium]